MKNGDNTVPFMTAGLGVILALLILFTHITPITESTASSQRMWPDDYTLGEQISIYAFGVGVGAIAGFMAGALLLGTAYALRPYRKGGKRK